MSYYLKIPLDPHVLLYEGTPWVLMSYYLEVLLDPHILLYKGTLGFSCSII
jgi:hypothetical protein